MFTYIYSIPPKFFDHCSFEYSECKHSSWISEASPVSTGRPPGISVSVCPSPIAKFCLSLGENLWDGKRTEP